jgi:DNA topoisomerase-3
MQDTGRVTNRQLVEQAKDYIEKNKQGIITQIKNEQKSKSPPLPFELTSLLSAAEQVGIDIEQANDIIQGLYLTPYSAITYPRTDCPYLPAGLTDFIGDTFKHLSKVEPLKPYLTMLDPLKRTAAWNDKKVKVHHGIIPTTQSVDFERLTDQQKAIYMLIVRRYMCQFMDDYIYNLSQVTIGFGKLTGSVQSTMTVSEGWRVLEPKYNKDKAELPSLDKNDTVKIENVIIIEKLTKAPKRYTKSSLAVAMANIASEVDDPELRKTLKDKEGIGTTATRTEVIKGLIDSELIKDEKGGLSPSAIFCKYLIHIPEQIKDPVTTAVWERGFSSIEDGKMTTEQFINFQIKFVTNAVDALHKRYLGIKE